MLPILPKNLGPAGYIIILQLVTIAFFGLLLVGTQLQSIDTKQILLQANQTSEDTNTLLSSGNRTNTIIDEVRSISNDIATNFTMAEASRLNQTKVFLPALQNSFENVERIVNISSELNLLLPSLENSINNVTNATNFLAENFGPDTGYIERENFQYAQANDTSKNVEEIRNLLRDLNNTLSS